MLIGYARVSTLEQNLDRQLETLKQKGVEKIFKEKKSGKNAEEREKLKECLEFCREGDTLVVADFTRLARSTKNLLQIIESMQKKGVNVVSIKENLDLNTATGRLMLTMLAGIAQFEREVMLERQAEGIAIAKRKGVYKGRKQKKINTLMREEFLKVQKGELSINKFAERCNINYRTAKKIIERLKKGE